MKEKIKNIIKETEKNHKIKILFAIENGSRAWGMESKDSDYDVRFVFIRPKDEYLKLNKQPDVLEIKNYGPEIDVVGFDLYKFCRMLSSSNPQVIEWLKTNIVYHGEQPKVLVDFTEKCKKISLFHHYKSMCKNNYLKYLKSHNDVTYKRYLYAMRGLINAKYVNKFMKIPLISFPETIEKCKSIVDDNVIKKLLDIIKLKKKGQEKDIIQNIVKLDNYIEEFLKAEEWNGEKENIVDTRELEKFILKILK